MKREPVRFLSRNPHKIAEATRILSEFDIEVIPLQVEINEIQTQETTDLVRDKVLKAFGEAGRPLFVEHTGLSLQALNGFPGGLTQVFWDTLGADRFASLFGGSGEVIARTDVGYTDGRRIHLFSGEVKGEVPSEPRGDREFQWDCVFIPTGQSKTFAEMGPAKDDVSMRRKALAALAAFLGSEHDS